MRLSAAALVTLLLTLPAVADERRPIRETDLLDFVWVADPQISSDGSAVTFVRVQADCARDTYTSSIWVVPTDGGEPRPLTAGRRDVMPRWSPDGRRLAFLRAAERDGRPEPSQVYLLDLNGGEPRAATALPDGVATFGWSPDGRRLVAGSNVKNAAPVASEAGRTKPSDVRVITRATFRRDGGGYLDASRRSRLFVITLADDSTGSVKPLGEGRLGDQDPVWSDDGARIHFTSQTEIETDYAPPKTALMEADAETGVLKEVAVVDGAVAQLSPSPDGRTLAIVASMNRQPVRSYLQPDLLVVDRATGAVRNLTERYDGDIAAGLSGDQRAPRGTSSTRPIWSRDGAALVVVSAVAGRTALVKVDPATATVTSLTDGDEEVQGATSSRDGRLALVVSTPTRVGDVFATTAAHPAERRQLTRFNDERFAALDLPSPEMFWTKSFDGARVQGWILKPPRFNPSTKYPLILQIHGGPHAAYGATFTHEFLVMAARGYVVVYTNPRGSSSYGQDFANVIQHRYPGDDYRDLIAALDEVVRRGYVDENRLGVTGGSGGGLLTNWALTQTTRFKAAVSQRSIADWEAWWYSADFTLFTPRWFPGPPWREAKDFATRSPITYADRITTPLMLVDGDADYRTPPAAGGEAMFRALKLRNVPVVMVRFPDEGHELSRSGAPWHRIDRLRHIVGWFDKWLLGQSRPEYDSP
jgi:dipeptidyl aminopeptidase/acylaminoacyl peptidase